MLQPPPDDYDDNPEWTAPDFARARPASEVLPPEVVGAFRRRSIRHAVARQGLLATLDQLTPKEN